MEPYPLNSLIVDSLSLIGNSATLVVENDIDYDSSLMNTKNDSVKNSSNLIPSVADLLSQSVWNVFDERYLRHSFGWTITLIVTYTLILIVGIIGNCMVILVVTRRPQMRSVTNMFIMNLAVADLFVIVFCVPATLFANIFQPWILGSFMCKAVAYVQGVSVCASAYSLAAISIDRCKAIYQPLKRPRCVSKSQALSTICLIWIIALLLTIPWAVIFDVTTSIHDQLPYCVETWENETHGKVYFLLANLICCYSLPLVLITLSNVAIWCHVSHRKVPQDSASEGTIKKIHQKTRHGVRKMLGIVTLAFCFSWLPLYILVSRIKFSKHIGQSELNLLDILLPFAQWLGSWNSSINPVLYAFLNSKFRKMFKSLLPGWVPFVHTKMLRTTGNHEVVGGTASNNGTFIGTNATRSCSTVCIAKSSRNGNNNSNSVLNHRHYRRMLLVSNFHDGTTGTASTTTITLPTTTTTSGNGFSRITSGNCVSTITANYIATMKTTHV